MAPASRWCQRARWPSIEAASLSLPCPPGFPSLPCPLTEIPPEAALSPLQVPDPWSGHQSLNATAALSHAHRGMLDIASRPVVKSPSVSSSHTASLGSMGQVGSDRNSAMQCIKGFFADDKTMTGRTYHLLLCPCTCMLLWGSRRPQHQCGIWNQHIGAKTTRKGNPSERSIPASWLPMELLARPRC